MKRLSLEEAVLVRQINPALTVYDTGEMLEPKTWPQAEGKVDFDDNESATIFIVFAHPSSIEDDTIVLNVDTLSSLYNLKIVVNDGDVVTIKKEDLS